MSEHNRQNPLTQLDIFLENNNSLACYREARLKPGVNGNGNGHKHSLPLDCITQSIDQAFPLGLQRVRLCGGEPFLYPGFETLLNHLERLELGVIIETSGSGLTAGWAARIARLPQASVTIALNSAGTLTHDTVYNPPEVFEIATRAIRLLSEAGLAPKINYTITRQNYTQIGAAVRLVELLGAEAIHFACSSSKPQASTPGKNGSLLASSNGDPLSMEEWIALGRKVEREVSKTTRLRLSVDLPPVFRGLHPQARVEGQGRCQVLTNLAVLCTGEYALCGGAEVVPDLVFGSVGSASLEQIWNTHPILTAMRETLPGRLDGICGRCIMKTACLGFCVAENYLSYGAFEGSNSFCQSAERVGLFPAGRLIENLLW